MDLSFCSEFVNCWLGISWSNTDSMKYASKETLITEWHKLLAPVETNILSNISPVNDRSMAQSRSKERKIYYSKLENAARRIYNEITPYWEKCRIVCTISSDSINAVPPLTFITGPGEFCR